VNTWHRFMGGRVRSKMNRLSVLISGGVEFSVGRRPITVNDRPRTNRLPDKRDQVLIVALSNLPNPDSPETFGLKHFDSDDHEYLGGVAFAPDRRNWDLPICERKVCFIDFNLSME